MRSAAVDGCEWDAGQRWGGRGEGAGAARTGLGRKDLGM